jgi:hypothetical protein
LRRWVVVALLAAALWPAAAAQAHRVNDAAATRAYVRVAVATARAVAAAKPARVAASEAAAAAIASECPSALTYAPRDRALLELTGEIAEWLWHASFVPLRAMALRNSSVLYRLKWSNRTLTRLVHEDAAEERAEVAVEAPAVCTQIQAWKAGDYAALPSSVSSFLSHLEAIEAHDTFGRTEEPREVAVSHMLRRYEKRAEKHELRKTERLEEATARQFGPSLSGIEAKLAAVLGVSAL